MEYYDLSETQSAKIDTSKQTIHKGARQSGYFFVVLNLLTGSLSTNFKSMALLGNLQIYKFVPIDYPPNLMALFDFDVRQSVAGLELSLKESFEDGALPDPYMQFDLSSYSFNNCGAHLIICYSLFMAGLVLELCLRILKQKTNKPFLKKIEDILQSHFLWGYPLSYFLAESPKISFLLFLGLRYPTLRTPGGILNFMFCLFSMIFLISVAIHSVLTLRKIKRSLPDQTPQGPFFFDVKPKRNPA